MGVSPGGEPVNFLDPDQRIVDFAKVREKGVFDSPDLVPVHVNFVGRNHLVVEENLDYDDEGGTKLVGGSLRGGDEAPPEVVMAEIYQYFANRTSPGGDRALRKQRRREKERLAKRRFESEHYVRIVNCSPTPSRPLQGLWKVLVLSSYMFFSNYLSIYLSISIYLFPICFCHLSLSLDQMIVSSMHLLVYIIII